jgi:uncharacterized protein (DUF3084 family)
MITKKEEERIRKKAEQLRREAAESNQRLARYQPTRQAVISELSELGRQNLVSNRGLIVHSHPADLNALDEFEVIVEN